MSAVCEIVSLLWTSILGFGCFIDSFILLSYYFMLLFTPECEKLSTGNSLLYLTTKVYKDCFCTKLSVNKVPKLQIIKWQR